MEYRRIAPHRNGLILNSLKFRTASRPGRYCATKISRDGGEMTKVAFDSTILLRMNPVSRGAPVLR